MPPFERGHLSGKFNTTRTKKLKLTHPNKKRRKSHKNPLIKTPQEQNLNILIKKSIKDHLYTQNQKLRDRERERAHSLDLEEN